MNGWQVLNGLAWGLSALLLGLMALDFIRVERVRASERKE